jgi:hypothetical protein
MPLLGSYVSITFDVNQATRYVQGRIKDILLQGMIAWVEEAKSRIPVWSGASRAALTQIAGFVGVPVFGPGKGTGSAHSNNIVAVPPRAKLGPADGQASETFTPPEVQGGKVFMRWTSNLDHLNINERVNVNDIHHHFNLIQPGPYELRQHCNDAAKKIMVSELNRFQYRIRSFINYRRRKLGG